VAQVECLPSKVKPWVQTPVLPNRKQDRICPLWNTFWEANFTWHFFFFFSFLQCWLDPQAWCTPGMHCSTEPHPGLHLGLYARLCTETAFVMVFNDLHVATSMEIFPLPCSSTFQTFSYLEPSWSLPTSPKDLFLWYLGHHIPSPTFLSPLWAPLCCWGMLPTVSAVALAFLFLTHTVTQDWPAFPWEIRSPAQTQRMDFQTCGVQWKWDFNGELARLGTWQAETPEAVTISIILSSVQIPLGVLHWLSAMWFTFFSHLPPPTWPRFPIGLFNICLLVLVKF
jgi:hypothetical protein